MAIRRLPVCACLAVVVAFVACGDGTSEPGPGPDRVRAVQSVSISPDATNVLKIGQEQAYTAAARWNDGTVTTETATWRSDAPSVATIDGAGQARGVDTGDATLVASVRNIDGTLRVRVVPDYGRTWQGDAIVTNCRETGMWVGSGLCADSFGRGDRLSIGFSLSQERDQVSGGLELEELSAPLSPIAIAGDGSVTTTARVAMVEDGVTFDFVFDPLKLRAGGDALAGELTMGASTTAFGGAVTVDFRLSDVTPLAGGLTAQAPINAGRLTRAIRASARARR